MTKIIGKISSYRLYKYNEDKNFLPKKDIKDKMSNEILLFWEKFYNTKNDNKTKEKLKFDLNYYENTESILMDFHFLMKDITNGTKSSKSSVNDVINVIDTVTTHLSSYMDYLKGEKSEYTIREILNIPNAKKQKENVKNISI